MKGDSLFLLIIIRTLITEFVAVRMGITLGCYFQYEWFMEIVIIIIIGCRLKINYLILLNLLVKSGVFYFDQFQLSILLNN